MRSFKQYIYDGEARKKLENVRRFKLDPEIWNYTTSQLSTDIDSLMENFSGKFKPNLKLLETLESPIQIEKEKNKLKYIIIEAFEKSPFESPGGKLWSVTRWIANNGKNPERGFVGNVEARWNNIFKKLGYLS